MASHTATYIFSSVYSFSLEGASEVVKRFESSPEGADTICAYDEEMETFCFECDSIRGQQTFQAFYRLFEKYVEEEAVQEVIFENPKVERLDATLDKPIEWVDPRGLIALEDEVEDSDDEVVQDNPYGNAYSTTWRPKLSSSNLTGRFAPALVEALSNLTDCVFYIDQDQGEIKVTGSTKEALKCAERKLGNLEHQLQHQAQGPKIVHLIETEKEVDSVLRFLTLRQSARTLRNTLVTHDFQHIESLHKLFVVRLLKLDPTSQQYLIFNTKVQPVGVTAEASASPGLWGDFQFKRIGVDNRSPVTLSKYSESLPVPDDESPSSATGTSTRKAELVHRWLQEGSSEILNPFLPVQGNSNTAVPLNSTAIGSATLTKVTDISKQVAASGPNLEYLPKPPSPRKRFGKVRKPKGAGPVEPLESINTPPENLSDLRLTDQAGMIRERVPPERAIVHSILSSSSHFDSPATVTQSRSRVEPQVDFELLQASIVPPEILPPYLEPVTEDVVQDQSPDQPRDWENQNIYVARSGRLIDVPPLSYTPKKGTDAPGAEPSIDNVCTERQSAPNQELISLLDATEEDYPELRMPLDPIGPTADIVVKRPTAPLRPILRLRILNTEKPEPGQSSSEASVASKAKSDKAPSETLQTANEVETRDFKRTMGQQKPAPKKEKTVNGSSTKENRAMKPDKSNFQKLNAAAENVLEGAMYFRGQVKLEVQIGRLMLNNISNQLRKTPFTVEEWPTIFAARETPHVPSSVFTNMLTTAMPDVQFIRDLNAPGGERMFNSQPSGCVVTYEFNCMTKDGDEINVMVDDTANYHTERPAIPLGSINWYYPKRTWDAKASLTGVVSAGDAYEQAVKALIDNLYIPDGNPLLDLVTKTIDNDLRIQAVTLRRQNRYDSVPRPSISLLITEVQDLYIQRAADSTDLIRARAKPPGEMVHDNRLWYEVSLSSAIAEEKFKENLDLELGDVASWSSREMVEAGVFEDLSLVARDVVTRIDNVGYWNKGPRGGPSDGAMTIASTTNVEGPPGFW